MATAMTNLRSATGKKDENEKGAEKGAGMEKKTLAAEDEVGGENRSSSEMNGNENKRMDLSDDEKETKEKNRKCITQTN